MLSRHFAAETRRRDLACTERRSSGFCSQTDPVRIFCGPPRECIILYCSCPYDQLSLKWLKQMNLRLLYPSAGMSERSSGRQPPEESRAEAPTHVTLTHSQPSQIGCSRVLENGTSGVLEWPRWRVGACSAVTSRSFPASLFATQLFLCRGLSHPSGLQLADLPVGSSLLDRGAAGSSLLSRVLASPFAFISAPRARFLAPASGQATVSHPGHWRAIAFLSLHI